MIQTDVEFCYSPTIPHAASWLAPGPCDCSWRAPWLSRYRGPKLPLSRTCLGNGLQSQSALIERHDAFILHPNSNTNRADNLPIRDTYRTCAAKSCPRACGVDPSWPHPQWLQWLVYASGDHARWSVLPVSRFSSGFALVTLRLSDAHGNRPHARSTNHGGRAPLHQPLDLPP